MGNKVTFENLRTQSTEDLQAALKGAKGQLKAEIKRELMQRVEDAKSEGPIVSGELVPHVGEKEMLEERAAHNAKIDALEAAQELPELVPDIANPEGVPPAEQQEEQPTTPAPAAGPVLHVKQGLTLRGGRGEWYKLLCKYDGKPVADYIAEGKANPASHYTARSTKCGQPKTPESRLSWFKRAGIVTIK